MADRIRLAINKLSKLNVDKYVRKSAGACEENVKIKIVIPLLNLLGYDTEEDMDFEHHVQNKKADIALIFDNAPKLLVETKDLDESLDNHIAQGLNYAYLKGIEWVMLTNGIEIRIYKSFIPGIANPKDRLLFETKLQQLPKSFNSLLELVGKEHLQEAKKLSKKVDNIRENITAQILIDDLTSCRKRLFSDLLSQFKTRYKTDTEFSKIIDIWAASIKMDVSDPNMIDKLCREGAYTLINRVLFLRICEDRGHIKAKLSKDAITEWRKMVEKPSYLLNLAFNEIGERFEGLYKSPLFDSIRFEDIDWNTDTINFVIDKLGEHNFSKISKDILGRAYEQHISREERKALGQFYTPDFVIDYILDRVNISTKGKILDPACGSGGFLVRTYDKLRKQYVSEGWDEKLIHKQILETNLYGIDINPFATQLTVMNLLLKDLNHPFGEINVVDGDTLEKIEAKLVLDTYQVQRPLAQIIETNKRLTYSHVLQDRPFDAVIGNPPYISFGTRGTLDANKEKRGYFDFLRKTYPNSAEYKLSLYAIFIDRGIELLANSGKLGFIVPDSFLLGQYYSKIRRRILDSCAIEEICIFKKDFWKVGIVGLPVVIILRKEKDQKKRLGSLMKICQCYLDSVSGEYIFKTNFYKQTYFEHNYLNRFRLFFTKDEMKFVRDMEHGSDTLSKFVNIHSGIRPKGNRKLVINNAKLGITWQRGLISSGEVKRYKLYYAGNFINIQPELLWSGGWKPSIVNADKLLLCRTGDSIIATYDCEGMYHLDNIDSIVSKNSDISIKYILAILNSKLMNHYYHLISLESGRVMAQLDIETIEHLPIKQASKRLRNEIVKLVDNILSLNKELVNEDIDSSESIQKSIEQVDKEIEYRVREIYGMPTTR